MNKSCLQLLSIALSASAGALLFTSPLHAAPRVPPNLAGGLGDLVESNLDKQEAMASGKKLAARFTDASGKTYTNSRAAEAASAAQIDDQGRILVRAHLDGLNSVDKVNEAIAARVPSFEMVAADPSYKGGVIGGYVSIDDVPALAYTRGVRSVQMEQQPETNKVQAETARAREAQPQPDASPGQTLTLLGTTFDQGVTQHRVDNINKFYNPGATVDYQGSGISIGFMSDSYNTNASATTRASTDVANFDLPGASNNPVNTQPVVLLQDSPNRSDEGRGMGQILYKMAPKARLAFATAAGGEVNFAHNIRALAGLPSDAYAPAVQLNFAADVIVDDISYGTMPFFEDGIVANAVDDVAAIGVSYFSSAGNDIGTYDYDSDFRYVPVASAFNGGVLQGTNINLAGVPANLYQGGFHNFRTDGGVDLAQTVNVITVAAGLPQTNFQWDDPFNQTVVLNGPSQYHATGNHPGGTTQQTYTIPNSLQPGTRYVITVLEQTGSGFDAIVTLKDPSGNTVVNKQDTGTGEYVQFIATTATPGYQVIVESFNNTTGPYEVDLYFGNKGVTSDFNILAFRVDTGAYLPNSSLRTNNVSSNIPQELATTPPPAGQTQIQYVITRAAVPNDPAPATHLRWIIRGNGLAGIGPAEYITYNTPNAGLGHRLAKGCIATAAFAAFRPSQIPEYYTSPGPAVVYFDKFGNRLGAPEVRLKPEVAATDNANTSFFGSDTLADVDTFANFSGTSAAAPHAAAIAALVLQAHGGHGTVTPNQMRTILERSAFPHDLDPNFASASARTSLGGKVSISIASDLGLNPSAGAFNPNSINVSYVGPGSLTSLTFNPEGTAATAGDTTQGNNGLDASNKYFSNIYPGIVFQPATIPFTLGNSVGLGAGDVSASFTNLAPPPSNGTNQVWTMSLSFPTQAFTGGKVLRFTVGHGPQHNSQVSNGTGPTGGVTSTSFTQADLFGGGVLIPEGTLLPDGMTFSGTTSGGGTFNGRIQNRIGVGFSVTEGFGFINAENAVTQPLP